MARQSQKIPPENQHDALLPPLPIPLDLWLAVAKEMGLVGQLRRVAELIVRGVCDRQIEETMRIRHSTLRTYIDRIALQTGARGRMAILRHVLAVSHQIK